MSSPRSPAARLAVLAAAGLVALAAYWAAYLAASRGGHVLAYYGGLLWLDRVLVGGPVALRVPEGSWRLLLARLVYYAHPVDFLLVAAAASWLDEMLFWRLLCSMLTVSLLSSALYAVLPTAPPWMTVPGLEKRGEAVLAPYASADPYASFPSLHVAYSVLAAYGAARMAGRRYLALAYAWPLLMSAAVLATGNHYVADVLAGALISAAALAAYGGLPAGE